MMGEIKIEKGIPIVREEKWLSILEQMQIGDSFLCTFYEYCCCRRAANINAMRIIGAEQDDGRYRVWRIE